MSPYEILNLPDNANASDIKQAYFDQYKTLQTQWYGADTPAQKDAIARQMRVLNEVYNTIKDKTPTPFPTPKELSDARKAPSAPRHRQNERFERLEKDSTPSKPQRDAPRTSKKDTWSALAVLIGKFVAVGFGVYLFGKVALGVYTHLTGTTMGTASNPSIKTQVLVSNVVGGQR